MADDFQGSGNFLDSPYDYGTGESFEGYNVGAYRGAWNDDLQQDARERDRQRRERRGTHQDYRQPGPYSGLGPKNFVRSDARIMDEVVFRLTQHGGVDASHIHVDVRSGVVTLTGTVRDRRQKRMAENAAETIPGVQDVENQLRIAAGQPG